MKGIKDLMYEQRWQTKHLMNKLNESKVPGSWGSYQNIYNLVDGSARPRDPGVYIVLSKMFNLKVEEIINRYSDVDFLPQSIAEVEEEVVINKDKLNW
jgi:hypothetical protein